MFVAGFLVIAAVIGGGVLVFALSRRDKEPALPGGGAWPGGTGPAAPPPQNVGGATPIGRAAPAGRGAPGGGAAAPPPPPPPGAGGEINCRNCGFALPPGVQFCPRCGKPQS